MYAYLYILRKCHVLNTLFNIPYQITLKEDRFIKYLVFAPLKSWQVINFKPKCLSLNGVLSPTTSAVILNGEHFCYEWNPRTDNKSNATHKLFAVSTSRICPRWHHLVISSAAFFLEFFTTSSKNVCPRGEEEVNCLHAVDSCVFLDETFKRIPLDLCVDAALWFIRLVKLWGRPYSPCESARSKWVVRVVFIYIDS